MSRAPRASRTASRSRSARWRRWAPPRQWSGEQIQRSSQRHRPTRPARRARRRRGGDAGAAATRRRAVPALDRAGLPRRPVRGLLHPGAYQLLFESDDQLPATRADHGPRLQRRIVELAHRVDPQASFAAALLPWSAWHGVVSLRLHKTE
ncbi:TetR-like C-terminal domain-containing protein [Embleya sp. NPDC055664]